MHEKLKLLKLLVTKINHNWIFMDQRYLKTYIILYVSYFVQLLTEVFDNNLRVGVLF